MECVSIELFDGSTSFFGCRHCDESKATASSGLSVIYNLDHLNGAGLLEEPRELRAVDAERKVTNKHLEVLGELPLGLRATLLLLHLRRHRDGHGRKPPPQR